MNRLRWNWAIAALLLSLGVPQTADATVMVEVSLEDMVRDSAFIVRGRVVDIDTELVMTNDGGVDPYTLTTVEVSEWIKGESTPSGRVVIRELGGLIGRNGEHGGMWIDGTPRYHRNEEVIVFLERRPNDASLRTYAMAQGKFVVTQGIGGVAPTVTRDTQSIAFANWTAEQQRWSGRMTIGHGARETLDLETFVDVVRAIQRTYGQGALLPGDSETVGGGR